MKTLVTFVCSLILMAAPSLAQTRPTLAEAESRIGVLEAEQAATQAAVCTKVELDGDSYRPYFCGGECGCLDTSTATGCTETAAGEFELVILEDQLVAGDCQQGTELVDYGPCEGLVACAGYGPFVYTCDPPFSGSCPSGYLCGGDGACHPLCSNDADCILEAPTTGECIAPVVACTSDADCPSLFWTCDLVESECTRPCGLDSDCDATLPAPSPYTLANVASVEAPEPVTCQGLNADTVISSNDALACIAEVEVVLGSPCAYLCGDGGIDPGEQCDDGNTTPGDGCDASCQLEP